MNSDKYYEDKYLKYKAKYLEQSGGSSGIRGPKAVTKIKAISGILYSLKSDTMQYRGDHITDAQKAYDDTVSNIKSDLKTIKRKSKGIRYIDEITTLVDKIAEETQEMRVFITVNKYAEEELTEEEKAEEEKTIEDVSKVLLERAKNKKKITKKKYDLRVMQTKVGLYAFEINKELIKRGLGDLCIEKAYNHTVTDYRNLLGEYTKFVSENDIKLEPKMDEFIQKLEQIQKIEPLEYIDEQIYDMSKISEEFENQKKKIKNFFKTLFKHNFCEIMVCGYYFYLKYRELTQKKVDDYSQAYYNFLVSKNNELINSYRENKNKKKRKKQKKKASAQSAKIKKIYEYGPTDKDLLIDDTFLPNESKDEYNKLCSTIDVYFNKMREIYAFLDYTQLNSIDTDTTLLAKCREEYSSALLLKILKNNDDTDTELDIFDMVPIFFYSELSNFCDTNHITICRLPGYVQLLFEEFYDKLMKIKKKCSELKKKLAELATSKKPEYMELVVYMCGTHVYDELYLEQYKKIYSESNNTKYKESMLLKSYFEKSDRRDITSRFLFQIENASPSVSAASGSAARGSAEPAPPHPPPHPSVSAARGSAARGSVEPAPPPDNTLNNAAAAAATAVRSSFPFSFFFKKKKKGSIIPVKGSIHDEESRIPVKESIHDEESSGAEDFDGINIEFSDRIKEGKTSQPNQEQTVKFKSKDMKEHPIYKDYEILKEAFMEFVITEKNIFDAFSFESESDSDNIKKIISDLFTRLYITHFFCIFDPWLFCRIDRKELIQRYHIKKLYYQKKEFTIPGTFNIKTFADDIAGLVSDNSPFNHKMFVNFEAFLNVFSRGVPTKSKKFKLSTSQSSEIEKTKDTVPISSSSKLIHQNFEELSDDEPETETVRPGSSQSQTVRPGSSQSQTVRPGSSQSQTVRPGTS